MLAVNVGKELVVVIEFLAAVADMFYSITSRKPRRTGSEPLALAARAPRVLAC